MKKIRALAPALAVAALLAPASANAGTAVTDSLGSTALGTVQKTLNTLSGKTDASCQAAGETSKPFSAWGDRADYVEAPGGTFEDAASSWTTAGSVTKANENEPWYVSGDRSDDTSVVLGTNASITSGTLCAGLEYPTLRFFARSTRGISLALVTLRYPGPDGLVASLPLGVVTVGSSWQPTLVALTGSGLPVLTGKTLSVRISPILGSLQVDDVYVDPFRRA